MHNHNHFSCSKEKIRIVALSNLRYNKKDFKRKQINVYPPSEIIAGDRTQYETI